MTDKINDRQDQPRGGDDGTEERRLARNESRERARSNPELLVGAPFELRTAAKPTT
jgi:hypothetical protein